MPRKRELFFRTSIQTNAGTAVNLASETVKQDELWEPTFIGIYNNSGEDVKADLAIFRTSDTLILSGDNTVTNAKGYGTNIAPMVGPSERIGFVVTGTADKAQVWLVLSGWIHCLTEDPADYPAGVSA